MKRILYLPLFIIFILSCGKSGLEEVLVDPKNANEVAKIILTPDGGETKTGTPPPISTKPGTLNLTTTPDRLNNATQSSPTTQSVTASQGTTVTLKLQYNNCNYTSGNCNEIRAKFREEGTPYCIYRVKGSDSYKIYRYSKNFGNSGTLNFPFTIPDNIGNGSFDVEFSIVDEFGLVTNYNTTTVNMKRLSDAENPAKAYGCDFTKISNELTLLSKLDVTNPVDCEVFKVKYNQIVQAMIKCNQISQSDKNQLIEANKSVQGLTCR